MAFIARLSCRFCFPVADSGSPPLAVEQGCGCTTQNSYGHSSHSLRLTRTSFTTGRMTTIARNFYFVCACVLANLTAIFLPFWRRTNTGWMSTFSGSGHRCSSYRSQSKMPGFAGRSSTDIANVSKTVELRYANKSWSAPCPNYRSSSPCEIIIGLPAASKKCGARIRLCSTPRI